MTDSDQNITGNLNVTTTKGQTYVERVRRESYMMSPWIVEAEEDNIFHSGPSRSGPMTPSTEKTTNLILIEHIKLSKTVKLNIYFYK